MLKRFDLLFVCGTSPLARLIQWVTALPYSHVTIIHDSFHMAETDWRFSLQWTHNNYPPWQYDVFRYRDELTAEQGKMMMEFIQVPVGTPYNFWQTITNGLYLLTGLPTRDAPSRMNCSGRR